MNHTEAPIADGYYWAKFNFPNKDWFPLCIKTKQGKQFAVWFGNTVKYPLTDFTFGPRIEPPTDTARAPAGC